ncbi:MAG: hypothetical protein PVI30_05495 [Myxococcales bacterium]|jgi:hypothetical protein
MPELLWVIGVLMLIGAAGAIELVPWPLIVESGNDLMLASAALGIPLEIAYFLLLWLCLRHGGAPPAGWYWVSFKHHHLLGRAQRWLVLPLFYAGALSFLGIVFGIATVLLGMLAAAVQ